MSVVIKWAGYPRSYTAGRRRPIQFLTLHYTAGSEGPTSAEAGIDYDKRRTDGTSCHYFVDSLGPVLQEVPDGDRSHCARMHGNEIGIHIEICGTRQTRAQWLDGTSYATLRSVAGLLVVLGARHDIPMRRLSTAETRAAYFAADGRRPKGVNDHAACTAAFPEDQGDHTDVGDAFPWDVLWTLVDEEGDTMAATLNTEDQAVIRTALRGAEAYQSGGVAAAAAATGFADKPSDRLLLETIAESVRIRPAEGTPIDQILKKLDAITADLKRVSEKLDALASSGTAGLVVLETTTTLGPAPAPDQP